MSRLEKVIILVLTLSALLGTGLSYHKKASRDLIETVSVEASGEARTAEEAIQRGKIVHINSAEEKELCKLPGVGPQIAARIAEYRRENGIFSSPDELLNVKGIGPKKYEKMKDLVRIE